MHIIIARPMSEQEIRVFERGDVVDRAGNVSCHVIGRRGHVTFGVDRVVVEPVGDGSNGHYG